MRWSVTEPRFAAVRGGNQFIEEMPRDAVGR